MKKISSLGLAFVALTLTTSALANNFTAGNVVVYRIGDGAAQLTNVGSVVFLDEYNSSSGALVQSVMMPTNFWGGYFPLIASATASGEGELTRSADGRFIVLGGYGARIGGGSSALSGISAATVPRVVGLVDQFGHIDTSTAQTNALFNGPENPRSTVSTDGTNIWFGGDVSGIRYLTRGSSLATQLSSFIANIRGLNIYSNQLYFSDASGASARIGLCTNASATPIPTTTNNVFLGNLSGFQTNNGSPYQFTLLKLNGATADPVDTLYVADDGTPGGVYKWSLVGSTWTSNGFIVASNARGITGNYDVSGNTTNVHLYVTGAPAAGTGSFTGGGNLWRYTDSTGWNVAPSSNGGDIGDVYDWRVVAPGQKVFRGVAFAPVGGETFPAGNGRISVGPIAGFTDSGLTGCSATFGTKDYSISNPGLNPVTWAVQTNSNPANVNWLNFSSTGSGLASSGSVTVTVSFNANANSLTAGSYTGSVTFANTTSSPNDQGTTTRPVILTITDQAITPSTDYIVSGPPGGPFSPLTKSYTVSNGVNATTLGVSKSDPWLNLIAGTTTGSTLSVSLGSCGGTNITVAVNTNNANSLAAGNYSDIIVFSNSTSLIDTRNANLLDGFVYFCDDFSTYSDGDLNGQQGWKRHGTVSSLPIQVSGGVVTVPGAQAVNNEDVYKDTVLSTNEVNVFLGLTITVDYVGVGPANSSYFLAIIGKNGGTVTSGSFANYRINATNYGGSAFGFCSRTTGQATDLPTSGPGTLTTGTTYRLIVMTDRNGTNTTLFINPTSAGDTNSPYMVHTMGAGSSAATGAGGVLISQDVFGSGTVGFRIGKMCIDTNFADVFNSLGGGGPPPTDPFTTWQTHYFPADGPNAAPGADPDGDGISNTNEFLLGFNPTNNAARLKITSIARTDGTNVTITYLGASGDSSSWSPGFASRTNVLDVTSGTPPSYTNNFLSAGQTNILSGGTGLGQVATFVHTNGATGPARYYRVRVLLP